MGLLDSILGAAMGGGQQQGGLGALGGLLGGGQGGAANPKMMILQAVLGMMSGGGGQQQPAGGGALGALGGLLGGGGGQQAAGSGPGLGAVLGGVGGLGGLLGMMKQAGLGEQADSWVSTGENMPVDGQQISQVFGNERIQQMAQQFGLSPEEVSGHLAQILPEVVNHVTPNGAVPQQDELGGTIGSLLGMLGRR